MTLAAGGGEAALTFVEVGAVAVVLAALARLAGRLRITAVPLYLAAGLLVGEGGPAPLRVSTDLIGLLAEIGVLLLLLALGLEYTSEELRSGLRTGVRPGVVDAVANFAPGLGAGLLLGWDAPAAVLLGGVTWVSSSGIVAKVLDDLGRLGNRETPAVLNLLVVEDLAMAAYLPLAAALVTGGQLSGALLTVTGALAAVAVILALAVRFGRRLSEVLVGGSDESLLLAVFGLTLLVGGLAEQVELSAAIGAFLVGLALSGPVQERARQLIGPLRDLFAAMFFLSFSFQIRLGDMLGVLTPAAGLVLVAGGTKLASGWYAAGRLGVGRRGRWRAGVTLVPRGEFSIVIAALGTSLPDGTELGAMAAGFVLVTAVVGSVAARYVGAAPRVATAGSGAAGPRSAGTATRRLFGR